MRAAILEAVGTIPVFGDFKEPDEGDGRTVAEVLAAGLNPVDLMIAAGQMGPVDVPCVVGLEGVARIGDERVYFNGVPWPFGSIAQFAPVDRAEAFPVASDLSPGMAVALGIAGLAAWVPLETRAQLQRGESVLVLGASGMVGQLAVQAAKLLGAGRVVAAARHRETLEMLRERGADEVVQLGAGDDADALRRVAGDGYDVVLDALYGAALEAALPATAMGARAVTVGANAGPAATIPLSSLYGRTLMGHAGMTVPGDVRRAAYERMGRHAVAGELTVDVVSMPLSDIERAWRAQAGGPHRKIVIVP
jgi:NADPH:quinone reductase-like Zn-dependent oxidoreductase